MTNLLSLADAVERAERAERALDAEIELATGNWGQEHYEAWHLFQECGEAANPPLHEPVPPRRLTGSLDAAMTLVPEGWRISGLFQRNCRLPNWIWKAELWHPEADANVRGIARNVDSAALALTAAALRARAHTIEGASGDL